MAVFDLDGTVFRGALTFEVAEKLMESGSFANERKEVNEAQKIWKERGSIEAYWIYNKTLLRVAEEAIFPRVTPTEVSAAAQSVLKERGSHTYAYTTDLIRRLKAEGRTLVAISGSIKDIVEPFAKGLGFDIVLGSELVIVDGKYTGRRVSQTNKNKGALLQALAEEHALTLGDSIGVGDTHRDISLLKEVQHPIAFNPNAALYEEAAQRGWKIVVERKNMVFEMVKDGERYVIESAHPSHSGEHQEHLR